MGNGDAGTTNKHSMAWNVWALASGHLPHLPDPAVSATPCTTTTRYLTALPKDQHIFSNLTHSGKKQDLYHWAVLLSVVADGTTDGYRCSPTAAGIVLAWPHHSISAWRYGYLHVAACTGAIFSYPISFMPLVMLYRRAESGRGYWAILLLTIVG